MESATVRPLPLEELNQKDRAHLIHPGTSFKEHARLGSELFVGGEGVFVIHANGKRYMDTHAGMGNALVGYGRSEIVEAAAEQMRQLSFFPSFFRCANVPSIELAAKLAEITPRGLSRVYFTCGGSESNETAFKLVRLYFKLLGKERKTKIIARNLAYHGLSYGALSATGIPMYRQMFGPLMPDFLHIVAPYCYRCELKLTYPSCELACARQLEQLIQAEGPETVAAFIAEPVYGSGGQMVPPVEYLPLVREICDRYEVLLIADEVVTGFGRTGKMFAVEHWNVVPDIITLAKGITSGYLPLGAVVIQEKVYQAMLEYPEELVLRHGFTFNSHPACCAAALKNIEIIEREGLVERSRMQGAYLLQGLKRLQERWEIVGDVRGLGLLAAVELVRDRATREPFPPQARVGAQIFQRAFERGVILRIGTDAIHFRPPLVISREEIDLLVDTLDQVIGGIQRDLS